MSEYDNQEQHSNPWEDETLPEQLSLWEPAAQPPEPPKKRGRGLIAAVLCGVLVLGAAGGVAGGYFWGRSHREQPTDTALSIPAADSTAGDAEPAADAPETAAQVDREPLVVTTNNSGVLKTPADVYASNVDAVVSVANESTTQNIFGQVSSVASSGSGFIIDATGYIVTNYHVVEGAQKLSVTLTSGETFPAELVGGDADNDVALLKIEATSTLPTCQVGDSDQLQVGEMVAAIGNPLGELTNTLTVGYISALDREINTDGTPINMLQTDAAINSGNSGGPLFDMYGNVIGITTAKYASSSIEGLGFAIPINDAMYIIYDLMEYGYVTSRPYMGVSVRDLDSVTASYYSLPTGVYVGEVTSGGAAEKAGVQKGDIIIGLDDYEISSYTELSAALKHYHAGDTAKMTVYRAGAQVELNITFDERQPETTSTDTTEQPESDIDADVEASPFSGWTIGGETGGNGGNVH